MLLVVEDNELVRRFLVRGLEGAGYTVREAADGRAALELLKRKHDAIHLVIADVRMPGFDGYALADWMAVWDFQHPLIFMTGYERPSRPLPGPLLFKPFPIERLVSLVRKSLRVAGIRPSDPNPARVRWTGS
jgi:two-component system, cell cycle sensor histidine kinase and response regulator CckA